MQKPVNFMIYFHLMDTDHLFYNLPGSHLHLPLIDNIFINDMSCHSTGGNITSSVSNRYFQFSQLDIFESLTNKYTIKYARVSYKFYRNMIVTLLKQSKKNYYSYFIENQNNVKKTWDSIRNLKHFEKENILTHKDKLQKGANEL